MGLNLKLLCNKANWICKQFVAMIKDSSITNKSKYKLRTVIVKPTLLCNGNCSTCSYRKNLHRSVLKEKMLSLDDWRRILAVAKTLGAQSMGISGGEPTLYKDLVALVEIGKNLGFEVYINSNGGIINQELASQLLEAGLDKMMISLYASTPRIHDRMKGRKGLWHQACNALKIFDSLKKDLQSFKLTTQTFITKENYLDFDKLVRLHYALGSESVAVSYLEGDYFKKKHLLDIDELREFRDKIIPKAIAFCKTFEPDIREEAIQRLEVFYSSKTLSHKNFSKGIYRPKDIFREICPRPQWFAIILANGDVHPCNAVEYSHEPVMGNLFKKSFLEIWHSKKWDDFRKNNFNLHEIDYCTYCPMPIHTNIRLR